MIVMYGMFEGCSSLTSLDVSGWDTGNVTNMKAMFADCSSLKKLDINGFNTGNVFYMSCMFESCSSLASLDMSGWDIGNVVSLDQAFFGCNSLVTITLPKVCKLTGVSLPAVFADSEGKTYETLPETDGVSFTITRVDGQ